MKTYVPKPQLHNAIQWDGSHDQAQEIIDYVLQRKNANAVFRPSVSAVRKILRLQLQGKILDMYPGQVFLHNLATDEVLVVPGDYFLENFREAQYGQKAQP